MIYKGINTRNNSKKHKKYKYVNIDNKEEFFNINDIVTLTNIKKYILVNMFTGKTKNKTNFIRYDL